MRPAGHEMMPEEREAFDVAAALPCLAGAGWRAVLRGGLERLLGLDATRRNFRSAAALPDGEDFAKALQAFGVGLDAPCFAAALPKEGPVVVMANHPFGGADALALGALCRGWRPDSRVFANALATALPGIGRHLIPLAILGEEDAARTNAMGLRQAVGHLRGGGLIAVFPSGEVARRRNGVVAEGPWLPQVVALALKLGAQIVVVRFSGGCPVWWHFAGAIHPMLRTALLPRVLLAMRGASVKCRALRIDPATLVGLDAEAAAVELRAQMLALGVDGL